MFWRIEQAIFGHRVDVDINIDKNFASSYASSICSLPLLLPSYAPTKDILKPWTQRATSHLVMRLHYLASQERTGVILLILIQIHKPLMSDFKVTRNYNSFFWFYETGFPWRNFNSLRKYNTRKYYYALSLKFHCGERVSVIL